MNDGKPSPATQRHGSMGQPLKPLPLHSPATLDEQHDFTEDEIREGFERLTAAFGKDHGFNWSAAGAMLLRCLLLAAMITLPIVSVVWFGWLAGAAAVFAIFSGFAIYQAGVDS